MGSFDPFVDSCSSFCWDFKWKRSMECCGVVVFFFSIVVFVFGCLFDPFSLHRTLSPVSDCRFKDFSGKKLSHGKYCSIYFLIYVVRVKLSASALSTKWIE